jgi:plastocyanin
MCSSDNGDGSAGGSGNAPSHGGTNAAGGSTAATTGGRAGASTGGTTAAPTITIQNFAYSPSNLDVSPGDTVAVVNHDAVSHSVTSQSATGNFTPGAVSGVQFDTGVFAANATATFTIPASAPANTVVPYYCSVHLQGMGQGTVTIR